MSDTETKPEKAAEKAPGIRIVSRAHEGFRRGGHAHPADATYPADYFTAEQLALIENEPLLTVIVEDGAQVPKTSRKK
ncbi:MAG TPA: HI1506-related protein [Bosea sp. (in: a-proteobacteria)]|jgi:hypothetical protein|uniref:HI1506-related protein n=1 Tax=Bosea sp. (in: a-proteobacteria) TaxID=1871050 RepID=UPI002DDCB758|nr:HI1506-related protein [Bosea sp. (in: a-proteobacteria)]HEV2556812.1 HI1506-related protein [Bosea sp. (in: a-proteobacteria)]